MVRPERPDDNPTIFKVVSEAFAGDLEARLVNLLRDAGDLVLSLVFEQDGRILGHIAFSRLQIEGLRAVALAPLAVQPDSQKRGIGAELVRAGLDQLRERGEQTVFVLGHPDYYPRFGFQSGVAAQFESPYAGPAFFALELQPGSLHGRSGPVVYAPAFDAFSD